MKLSEALINRSDANKHLVQLRSRLQRSSRVQEGDEPPENPEELLQELDRTLETMTSLIKAINHTNSQTQFDENRTLAEALADRDELSTKRGVLQTLIQTASVSQQRQTRSEVKFVSTINIQALQKQSDDLAKQYRELDTKIQELNWTTELIEK
ncbi:MAG: DIP1984 family protein [Chloroflexota bacterium]